MKKLKFVAGILAVVFAVAHAVAAIQFFFFNHDSGLPLSGGNVLNLTAIGVGLVLAYACFRPEKKHDAS